ncbi:MAG: hypothetical protein ACE5OP_09945 [Candidatus Glassbacteria bacterium]
MGKSNSLLFCIVFLLTTGSYGRQVHWRNFEGGIVAWDNGLEDGGKRAIEVGLHGVDNLISENKTVPNMEREHTLKKNLILVTICAIRCDEAFEDTTHAYIPRIWYDLSPLGTIAINLYSTCITKSTSGHYALITGTRNNMPNIEWIRHPSFGPRFPTLFDYIRRQKLLEEDDVWMIMPKYNGYLMNQSVHPYGGAQYKPSVMKTGRTHDIETALIAEEVMDTYHPQFLQMTFTEADLLAHTGDWEGYTQAIRTVDEIVYLLWQKIENDPFYQGNTTLIVTGDHGRYDDLTHGFRSHGGTDHGSQHILFLVIGPGIKESYIVERRINLIDIAPTIGRILDVDLPFAEGKVIEEMFVDSDPGTFEEESDISLFNGKRITHTPQRSLKPDLASDGAEIHMIWSEEDDSAEIEKWKIAHIASTDCGATWSDVSHPFEGLEIDGTPVNACISIHGENPEVSVTAYHGRTDALGRRKYGWIVAHTVLEEDGTWEPPVFLRNGNDNYLWDRIIQGRPGFSFDGFNAFNAIVINSNELFIYKSLRGGIGYRLLSHVNFRFMDPLAYIANVQTVTEGETAHIVLETHSPASRIMYARISDERAAPDTLFYVDDWPEPSFKPAMAAGNGTIHFTWSEFYDDTWQLCYRTLSTVNDSLGPTNNLSLYAASAINPDIAANGDTVVVIWEDYRYPLSQIFAKISFDSGMYWSDELQLSSTGGLSINPTLLYHAGKFFLAWQEMQDGNWEIYFDELPLSSTPDYMSR